MGSRAVAVVCRSADVARDRFGVDDGTTGAIYTRTGRPFFPPERTEELLERIRAAAASLWSELETDWLLLDLELLPWSAKAGDLLRQQYAPVGAAARAALPAVNSVLATTAARLAGTDASAALTDLLARQEKRLTNVNAFTEAYGRYCWPVNGLAGITLAPFAILAGASGLHAAQNRDWHLTLLDTLATADPELFRPTRRSYVDVTDDASVTAATTWWTDLTSTGGEGMVVKPVEGLARGKRGPAQPGIKCRGKDYLRIIYGPDYPEHLDRLRQRSLNRKRSLALREYALGLEALTRLTANAPLWQVHEPVFAVLALESEPIDPRL